MFGWWPLYMVSWLSAHYWNLLSKHVMSQTATWSYVVQGTVNCISIVTERETGLFIALTSNMRRPFFTPLTFSQWDVLVKVWNYKFCTVHLLQNASVCVLYSAPRITGQCTFVSSTSRSLTFRWTAAKSATGYHLVGHSKAASVGTNRITVNSLTPGSRYTFTVWAVGWQGLLSNNITCTDSTGLSEISFNFFLFLHQQSTSLHLLSHRQPSVY